MSPTRESVPDSGAPAMARFSVWAAHDLGMFHPLPSAQPHCPHCRDLASP
jgi:hypothetical protein